MFVDQGQLSAIAQIKRIIYQCYFPSIVEIGILDVIGINGIDGMLDGGIL